MTKQRRYQLKNLAKGLCAQCKRPRGPKLKYRCRRCADQHNAWQRQWRK